MASFNLGRIKGDKGDIGPKGEKGDKGDKGERGENGARGTDGYTPVFSIGAVTTADSSEDASVTIAADDPKNPKLFFTIPRGSAGKDAAGDMQKAIYDKDGLGLDFYEYAQNLKAQCLLKSGGSLSGNLIAAPGSTTLRCVRNISVTRSLPELCSEGDICIVNPYIQGVKIGECSVGSTIIVTEADEDEKYIIAAKDYHAEGSVTLIRKHLINEFECFDYNAQSKYAGSYVDMLTENIFKERFSENFKRKLKNTNIGGIHKRHCFIPSREELEEMDYFVQSGKEASLKVSTFPAMYMTRSLASGDSVYCVSDDGNYILMKKTDKVYLRPFIVVDSGIVVENLLLDGETVSKITQDTGGIYVFTGGEWSDITPYGYN